MMLFNNTGKPAMSTMNFIIPDEIKDAFNKTFANHNKNAMVAHLLQEAVAKKAKLEQQRNATIEHILARIPQRTLVDPIDIQTAREGNRVLSFPRSAWEQLQPNLR